MNGATNEQRERDGSRGSSVPRRPRDAIEVWGVLNVTPDSFSDGGAHLDPGEALRRALEMLGEGADVIDIGGASSRPRGKTYGAGAAHVELDEELRRTVPVIEALLEAREDAVVSIDTTSAEVADAALARGARIVNDVSMGQHDALLEVCAARGAELVLMHTRGDGSVDASTTAYRDLVEDVAAELLGAVARAVRLGVDASRVWIDPGLGFAKTAAQSMALLAATERLVATGLPVLVGASRKSFLGVHSAREGERVPGPSERLGASLAAASLAARAGARGVRVHDVRETVQAVRIGGCAREVASGLASGGPSRGGAAPALGGERA